jgi:threonine dehydrogenase-like Zn-dependent dehydrogenase
LADAGRRALDSKEVMDTARYAVLTAPRTVEIRERPLPGVPPDGGLLRLEACGVCGTDVALYAGHHDDIAYPLVPGHEPVGRIERIGAEASERWAVKEGDRVVLLSDLRCGRCRGCRNHDLCVADGEGVIRNYGFRDPAIAPSLWGGFATHLFLAPEALVVPMSASVPVGTASLYNALANGVDWAIAGGGVSEGSRVIVFGPGPRGIACAIAASVAGAADVAMVGLEVDADRLELATEFGVDRTVILPDSDRQTAIDLLGRDADVVIDTTPGATGVVGLAVAVARRGGTVVLAGFKGHAAAPLPVDEVIRREILLRGVRGKAMASTVEAVRILESGRFPFEQMASDAFPLDKLATAIEAAEATGPGRRPTHVRVEPGLPA